MKYGIREVTLILLLTLICIIVIDKTVDFISKQIRKRKLFDNINEWSYKRFSRFFGKLELDDNEFATKLKTIWELIIIKKEDDIEKIASLSNCSFEECLFKIQYLKNKRKIGNYYIDTTEKVIRRCTPEDEKLLKNIYHLYINYICNQVK